MVRDEQQRRARASRAASRSRAGAGFRASSQTPNTAVRTAPIVMIANRRASITRNRSIPAASRRRSVVYEQPRQVEEAREPGHHEDHVPGLDPGHRCALPFLPAILATAAALERENRQARLAGGPRRRSRSSPSLRRLRARAHERGLFRRELDARALRPAQAQPGTRRRERRSCGIALRSPRSGSKWTARRRRTRSE